MKNLMVSPEFEALSIPLGLEAQNALEKSLLEEGCKEPIIVWGGKIIDGHKRYQFCESEGIAFEVEEPPFSIVEEAISWICRERLRILDKDTAAYRYLVGKLYIAQKAVYRLDKKKPESERTMKLNAEHSKVSYFVGEEIGLHHSTVELYRTYAQSLDRIAGTVPALFRAILVGKVHLSQKKTEEFSHLSKKELMAMCQEKWNLDVGKPRRQAKKAGEHHLSVGIKEMPAYDPDMELQGLILTIPTWMMAMGRIEKKTGQATQTAKNQLAISLGQLRCQIDKLLGVIRDGYEQPH